ncbi:MAG TPA: phosphoglycerate dehydrogenase [Candidatus Polarisedimenticolia bacterium]|nr:phosphoglycerate dehydrogenase [Candidatus Polarisedimenticolia bacterium]
MKVLVADKVSATCADVLRAAGFEVEQRPGLALKDLLQAVAGISGLVVRSDTQVTDEVMAAAPGLKVVARAGAGVDNIDVAAATRRGIVVMNAAGENTISAAEHTMSMILALARRIPAADRSMRAGKWERGSAFLGIELFGKTLGILGVGKVGREVAARARAFGMQVLGYDPVLTAEAAARAGVEAARLDDVVERADVLTLHLPLTDETRHLLNAERIARCRKGVRIVNVARGGVIDEAALVAALQSGQVAGAALDVFEHEPPTGSPLLGLDSVVLTPHLGASTQEAQEKVAARSAEQVAAYLKDGTVTNAVNAEGVDARTAPALAPYRDLCERLGRLLSALARGPYTELVLESSGAVNEFPLRALTASFLKGLLEGKHSDPVNAVNALVLAREAGIKVLETRAGESQDFTALVTAILRGPNGSRSVSGTLFGKRDPRLVRVDEFQIDAWPSGPMLLVSNDDRPGMVGRIGTILGEAGVNIAYMSLGRDRSGGRALAVLNLDAPIPDPPLRELATLEGVLWAERVRL